MYALYRIQCLQKDGDKWTDLVNCAMTEFSDVLSTVFHEYLCKLGYETSAALAAHAEKDQNNIQLTDSPHGHAEQSAHSGVNPIW